MCAHEKPQYPQTEQKLVGLLPWLTVAIIIAVTAGLRFRLLDVPLERDEGEYAYAGQLMLQGVPPYLLAYNMKMPGIYAAYTVVLAVFGQTHTGIHIGLLVVNAATTVLIFLLAKYLTDSFAGVFAAAAFAVMSLAMSVEGMFANAEHFVVLFAVAGILLLLCAVDRSNLIVLAAASVLLGIGFLMKQHGIAFVVFAGLYLLYRQARRRPFRLIRLVATTGLFVIGAALPFGLMCLILWRAGVFEKFWFWTFVYARQYVSMVPLGEGLEPLKLQVTNVAGSAILIWILAGVGLLISFLNRKIRSCSPFIVGFLLFSFLSTCPGLYFRSHYFVLMLPAIALLSGVGVFGIRLALGVEKRTVAKNSLTVFLAIVTLFCTLYQQKDCLLAQSPAAVSRMIYGSNPFPESLEIAKYIKANSSSSDTIAILGSEPQIFFYANRRSATGYIYVYPLMELQPYVLQMQKEMIQQIEAAEPKYLIFVGIFASWLIEPASNKLIFDWFEQYHQQHYSVVGIIDFISEDNVVYRWDQDAANYHPRSPLTVTIFERNE